MDRRIFAESCFWQPPFAPSVCFDLAVLLNAALIFVFVMGMIAGASAWQIWQRRKPSSAPSNANPESGSVFFALFAAVGMVAVLGVGITMFMRGPVSSVSKVTRYNIAQNDMLAATAVITQASLVAADGDCDEDGFIEPLAFQDSSGAAAPSGGGLLPLGVGVNRRDPWLTDYGYCVWDHGEKVQDDACGGDDENRSAGGDTREASVIAVISAGPDKAFQTRCEEWADNDTPVVHKPSGSDDIVRVIPYAQMVSGGGGNMQFQELPDDACTASTVGIVRLFLGSPQICLEDGWTEIGGVAVQSAGDFMDVIGAEPGSAGHNSGTISFSGFSGSRPLTVEGAAQLYINGNPVSSPAAISAGDTIELRATAPADPDETSTFSVLMSGIRKGWSISTRAKYPPNLTITPASAAMNVIGPGTPAYSASASFVIRNMGEQATATLHAAHLSPLDSYEFYGDGDGCAGALLPPYAESSAQCIIEIRAKSSGDAVPSGTLNVTDGASANATANLSGSISGFSCTLDGVTVPNGSSGIFYSHSSSTNCAGVSASRTCNNGTLDGSSSYQYSSCATLASCTLDGATVAHGSSRTFYSASSSANCAGVSASRTCNNGTLSGSSAYQYASCSALSNCTLDGVTVTHGSSRYFYRYEENASCNSYRQNRTCNNGTLSGSSIYKYASCSAPPANCTLDGVTVSHGSSRYFYQYEENTSCNSYRQNRTCNNGTLSGSSTYRYASCSAPPPPPGSSCGSMTLDKETYEYFSNSITSTQTSSSACKSFCESYAGVYCCVWNDADVVTTEKNKCHAYTVSSCQTKWQNHMTSGHSYGVFCTP